jgi:hypothetical protein
VVASLSSPEATAGLVVVSLSDDAQAGASIAVLARNEEKNQCFLSELQTLGVAALTLRVDVAARGELQSPWKRSKTRWAGEHFDQQRWYKRIQDRFPSFFYIHPACLMGIQSSAPSCARRGCKDTIASQRPSVLECSGWEGLSDIPIGRAIPRSLCLPTFRRPRFRQPDLPPERINCTISD